MSTNTRISKLNEAGPITGAELIELVQGGSSVYSTVSNISVTASVLGTGPNDWYNKN